MDEKENLSCVIIEGDLCGALATCNCGACAEPIERWLDCMVDNSPILPPGCQVRCPDIEEPTSTDVGGSGSDADLATDSSAPGGTSSASLLLLLASLLAMRLY